MLKKFYALFIIKVSEKGNVCGRKKEAIKSYKCLNALEFTVCWNGTNSDNSGKA